MAGPGEEEDVELPPLADQPGDEAPPSAGVDPRKLFALLSLNGGEKVVQHGFSPAPSASRPPLPRSANANNGGLFVALQNSPPPSPGRSNLLRETDDSLPPEAAAPPSSAAAMVA